jgi:hypothetical protein
LTNTAFREVFIDKDGDPKLYKKWFSSRVRFSEKYPPVLGYYLGSLMAEYYIEDQEMGYKEFMKKSLPELGEMSKKRLEELKIIN